MDQDLLRATKLHEDCIVFVTVAGCHCNGCAVRDERLHRVVGRRVRISAESELFGFRAIARPGRRGRPAPPVCRACPSTAHLHVPKSSSPAQTIHTKIAKNVNVQHVQLRKHRCTHMFHQGAAKCTAVLSRSSECTEHPANGKYMYLCERTALYMFSSD